MEGTTPGTLQDLPVSGNYGVALCEVKAGRGCAIAGVMLW